MFNFDVYAFSRPLKRILVECKVHGKVQWNNLLQELEHNVLEKTKLPVTCVWFMYYYFIIISRPIILLKLVCICCIFFSLLKSWLLASIHLYYQRSKKFQQIYALTIKRCSWQPTPRKTPGKLERWAPDHTVPIKMLMRRGKRATRTQNSHILQSQEFNEKRLLLLFFSLHAL